jgi:hypothetical protein
VNVSLGCCGSCKSGAGGRFSINSGICMPSYNLMDASVIVGRFKSSSNPSCHCLGVSSWVFDCEPSLGSGVLCLNQYHVS